MVLGVLGYVVVGRRFIRFEAREDIICVGDGQLYVLKFHAGGVMHSQDNITVFVELGIGACLPRGGLTCSKAPRPIGRRRRACRRRS